MRISVFTVGHCDGYNLIPFFMNTYSLFHECKLIYQSNKLWIFLVKLPRKIVSSVLRALETLGCPVHTMQLLMILLSHDSKIMIQFILLQLI